MTRPDTLYTGYNHQRLYLDYTDTAEGRIAWTDLFCLIFEFKTFQDTISFHYPRQPGLPSVKTAILAGSSAYTAASLSLHNAVSQSNQMVAWDSLQSRAGPQPQPPPHPRQLHHLPQPGERGGGGRHRGSLYFSLCFIHVLDSATISYTILVYTWSSSISNYHTVYSIFTQFCKA